MKLFRHFRLLVAGMTLCLGALSTNAFALMGGAVQNGGVALGNVSVANGVVVSTLACLCAARRQAGSAGVLGTTDGTGSEFIEGL